MTSKTTNSLKKKTTFILSAGEIHFCFCLAGGQGRPSCAAVDLRLRDGRLLGLFGVFLLATRTRRGRVRLQPRTVGQSRLVHQYVLARFRSHTRRHDGRAVQSGRQGLGVGNRVRDRVTVGVCRRQDVPEPVGLVRPRHHVLDIRRILYSGHVVRVVFGAGDQEQDSARNPKRIERQEKPQKPQHRPFPTNGIVNRALQQPKEHDNRLTRLLNKCI